MYFGSAKGDGPLDEPADVGESVDRGSAGSSGSKFGASGLDNVS